MDFSALKDFMDRLTAWRIPGNSVSVHLDGKEVFSYRSGWADVEARVPMDETPDPLFFIFSCSKVATVTAALQLYERGLFLLDDPLYDIIPAFRDVTVLRADGRRTPARRPITLRHLFTMTAGLTYDTGTEAFARSRQETDGRMDTLAVIRNLAADPLSFEPGTRWQYSLCHDVLGAVVEIVSGMRFSDYLRRTIFDPLEMGDTGFSPTEEQRARFSQAYRYRAADGKAFPCEGHGFDFPGTAYESGGGGLFSCPGDYVRLMSALALGGTAKNGYRVLRPESVASLEVNRLSVDALAGLVGARLYGYGWGLCGRVHVDPAYSLSRASVGEFGWDGAAAAFAMVDRPHGIGLFFGTHVHSCTYAYHVLHPLIRDLAEEALGF